MLIDVSYRHELVVERQSLSFFLEGQRVPPGNFEFAMHPVRWVTNAGDYLPQSKFSSVFITSLQRIRLLFE